MEKYMFEEPNICRKSITLDSRTLTFECVLENTETKALLKLRALYRGVICVPERLLIELSNAEPR